MSDKIHIYRASGQPWVVARHADLVGYADRLQDELSRLRVERNTLAAMVLASAGIEARR